jgi:hypothetical protein
MLGRASRDLARALVERDGFELELLIDVDGLEDVVRSVEDNERIARDVCLASLRISHGCVSRCVCGRRTMIWFPSHWPWVTACSLACGRPGSMPRMNYLKAFATRASLFRECQRVESFWGAGVVAALTSHFVAPPCNPSLRDIWGVQGARARTHVVTSSSAIAITVMITSSKQYFCSIF